MKADGYRGLRSLIEFSHDRLSRGLVLVVEGVEGVGKTTVCGLLHEELIRSNVKAELLINHYERTDRTGPLIAAITENPCVKIENDITLFLLYCARMTDKLYASDRLSRSTDIVIVDRLDLSLRARAEFGWGINPDLVRTLLDQLCEDLYRETEGHLVICLDADKNTRSNRLSEKNKFRRRSSMKDEVVERIHDGLSEMCRTKNVPIVDTSKVSVGATISRIEEICREKGKAG